MMNASWDSKSNKGQPVLFARGVPATIMQEFIHDMRIGNLSPITIEKRVEIVERLRRFLDEKPLTEADTADLRRFQRTFEHLAPASVSVYTRHIQAFYRWARRRQFTGADPSEDLITPKLNRGQPHPIRPDDLQIILAATTGAIRIAFVLAAFAGLRRGEICAMQRHDLDLSSGVATALIHGKGGKERVVPLLGPVVDELHAYGLPRSGYVVRRNGKPYQPNQLSFDVYHALKEIGVETTLHSGRHHWCTYVARMTHDVAFVQRLAGHSSLNTTQVYVAADMTNAHERLAGFSEHAQQLLDNRPSLRLVNGER